MSGSTSADDFVIYDQYMQHEYDYYTRHTTGTILPYEEWLEDIRYD